MALSLILPCYKPPPGWEHTIDTGYKAFCAEAGENPELILVLDGVAPASIETALAFLQQHIASLHVVSYEVNRGKGYAIRQGVLKATGDIILYTDVDFPYTTASMVEVYKGLKENTYDVGMGVKDAAYYAHVPFLRKAISRFLRFLIRMFLSIPVTDTQCGLKGFRRDVAPLFMTTTIDRYLFDLEFIRNCFKSKKFRVKPVPVTLNENVHFRKMDYRILLPELFNFVRLLFK